MLVEFVGCTGAGKTTLIREVERRFAGGAITSAQLVTGLVGLDRVKHPTAQNLLQEALSFPFFLLSLHKNRAFLTHTFRVASRCRQSRSARVSNIRGIERKLGVHALLTSFAKHRIVLVDEGPLLAAHMLVPAFESLAESDIATFAHCVPLPDMIVYIRAPLAELASRAHRRPDPSRETACLSSRDLTQYLKSAAALFDALIIPISSTVPTVLVNNAEDRSQWQTMVGIVESFIRLHADTSRIRSGRAPADSVNLPGSPDAA